MWRLSPVLTLEVLNTSLAVFNLFICLSNYKSGMRNEFKLAILPYALIQILQMYEFLPT